MKSPKITAVVVSYVTVALGLFWVHSAWAAQLGFHICILIMLIIAKPPIPIDKLFKPGNHQLLLIGCAVLAASSGMALYLFWPMLGNTPKLSGYLASLRLTSITLPAYMIYFVLVNPWLEEYFWRGFLGSPSKNIIPTDLSFAGYHLLVIFRTISVAWLFPIFVSLTLVSWLWRQVSRLSDGLLIASISHLTADLSVMTFVYLLISKG